jgi:hypothetical protein
MTAWFFWQLVPHGIPTNLRILVIVGLTFTALPAVTYAIGLFEERNNDWLSIREIFPRVALIGAVLLLANFGPVSNRIDFVRTPSNQPLPPSAAPKVVKIKISNHVRDFLDSSAFKDD